MKYLITIFCVLIFSCTLSIDTKKVKAFDTNVDLKEFIDIEIPEIKITEAKKISSDTLYLDLILEGKYFTELNLVNKLELSLSDLVKEDDVLNHLRVSLNMPNRNEKMIDEKVFMDKYFMLLRKKYSSKEYQVFVEKVKELEKKYKEDSFLELADMDLARLIYKDDVVEKAFFGVNTLDICYKKIMKLEPEQSLFPQIIKDYSGLLKEKDLPRRKDAFELFSTLL